MKHILLLILLIIISFDIYSQKTSSVDGHKPVIVNSNKSQKYIKTYNSPDWQPDNIWNGSKRGDCSDFGFKGVFYSKKIFVTLNGSYSIKPVASFGVTFGMVKHFGWFVNVMVGTSFKTFSVNDEFDSGDTGSVPPFLKGDDYKKSARFSLMAGGLIKVSRPLALRLGVGYGISDMCYEGTDGKWFRDKKNSVRGIDCSAGLQYEFSKLLISIDAVATAFKELECKAGVGFVF